MTRITGGQFKGHSLLTPSDLKTRPTLSKLRQALFNSIQTLISGSRVVDLFAGSGALGFEALSRGADSVVLVEKNPKTCSIIAKNAKKLGVDDRVRVYREDVQKALEKLAHQGPFDLIFADPPYRMGWEERLVQNLIWPSVLSPKGVFLVEWARVGGKISEDLPTLVKVREKNYGDTVLSTFTLKEAS